MNAPPPTSTTRPPPTSSPPPPTPPPKLPPFLPHYPSPHHSPFPKLPPRYSLPTPPSHPPSRPPLSSLVLSLMSPFQTPRGGPRVLREKSSGVAGYLARCSLLCITENGVGRSIRGLEAPKSLGWPMNNGDSSQPDLGIGNARYGRNARGRLPARSSTMLIGTSGTARPPWACNFSRNQARRAGC